MKTIREKLSTAIQNARDGYRLRKYTFSRRDIEDLGYMMETIIEDGMCEDFVKKMAERFKDPCCPYSRNMKASFAEVFKAALFTSDTIEE